MTASSETAPERRTSAVSTPATLPTPPALPTLPTLPALPALHDDDLVAAVRLGDPAAFAELTHRHGAWMQGLAQRLLAGDHHLAQDVTQECLVRLHATITRDTRPLRVRPWLAVVVRNACMDEHRRRRPEPVADLPELAVHDEDPFDLDPHLDQAWAGLHPRFREVLHHRELLGLSYDEIAEAMGTSRSAVQTLLFRARAALRREYGRAGGQLLGCGAFGLSLLASFDGERVHDAGRLAAHVSRCDRCREALGRAGQVSDLLRGLTPAPVHVPGSGFLHGITVWLSGTFQHHLGTVSQVAQTGLIVGAIPLSAAAVFATHPATTGAAPSVSAEHATGGERVDSRATSSRGTAATPGRVGVTSRALPPGARAAGRITPAPTNRRTDRRWRDWSLWPQDHQDGSGHPHHDPSGQPGLLGQLLRLPLPLLPGLPPLP